MAGLKNYKNKGVIDVTKLNNRVPSQTDNAYDFFSKNQIIEGFLYAGLAADVALAAAPVIHVGPCNEITLQKIGTVTIAVEGSLDKATWVSANLVTSADGFIRIQSKYKYIRVAATSVSGSPSVYMMIS